MPEPEVTRRLYKAYGKMPRSRSQFTTETGESISWYIMDDDGPYFFSNGVLSFRVLDDTDKYQSLGGCISFYYLLKSKPRCIIQDGYRGFLEACQEEVQNPESRTNRLMRLANAGNDEDKLIAVVRIMFLSMQTKSTKDSGLIVLDVDPSSQACTSVKSKPIDKALADVRKHANKTLTEAESLANAIQNHNERKGSESYERLQNIQAQCQNACTGRYVNEHFSRCVQDCQQRYIDPSDIMPGLDYTFKKVIPQQMQQWQRAINHK